MDRTVVDARQDDAALKAVITPMEYNQVGRFHLPATSTILKFSPCATTPGGEDGDTMRIAFPANT